MSASPSTSLPYGPLVRSLIFFVSAALVVSLAGHHKASLEVQTLSRSSIGMSRGSSTGAKAAHNESATPAPRGGTFVQELVVDPAHPSVSHHTRVGRWSTVRCLEP